LPHMLHAAVVRSPHAHARILNIDASAARLMAGVVAVLTYQDIATTVAPRPIPLRARSYPGIERFLQYPLAHRKVRYVGEPVAAVIAETRYLAEDALDGVAVAYDPLPAIVDVWQSLAGEVLLFEEHGTNLAYEFASALGDVDEAFRQADYTRKETFPCHPHTPTPRRHAALSHLTRPDATNSRYGGRPRCPISTAGCWLPCCRCRNTASTL